MIGECDLSQTAFSECKKLILGRLPFNTNMNFKTKCLYLGVASGIITLIIGSIYIPPIGGPIPVNVDPEEYKKQQQLDIINSNGFKATISGAGLIVISTICILIKSYIQNRHINKNIRSKKITRIIPSQQSTPIQVVVDKTLPQGRKNPELFEGIQMVPYKSANIEQSIQVPKIYKHYISPLRSSFKYPPPYHTFNK